MENKRQQHQRGCATDYDSVGRSVFNNIDVVRHRCVALDARKPMTMLEVVWWPRSLFTPQRAMSSNSTDTEVFVYTGPRGASIPQDIVRVRIDPSVTSIPLMHFANA